MVALGETVAQNGQELLAEFIQYGHQKPFEEIVRRYAGMVFNVCFRITKDKHEAEDATQAVFLTLALQAKRGADIKALGPWLQQVAKRLALDNRRSKKRRKTREERHHAETTFRRECIDDLAVPSADLDELKTILHEELQKMPTKYRLPLILHYFGGLSREEMAAELNCKPSTLGVRIFRGREMLAGRLSGRGINITPAFLATAMGYAVKRAISETLITHTAHAATAMAAGHSGAGMASANVIGLTRRATGALAIGKVKVAAITLLLSSVSLGAGAKALGILPKLDLQRIISNQVERMMRPLLQPLTSPLRVDAQQPKQTTVATAISTPLPALDIASLIPHSIPSSASPIVAGPTAEITPNDAGASAVSFANAPVQTAWSNAAVALISSPNAPPAASVASDHGSSSDTPVRASESSGVASGGSSSLTAMDRLANTVPAVVRPATEISSSLSDVMVTMNDLVVGKSTNSTNAKSGLTTASTSTTSAPVQLIQIASAGGSVTQSSDGVIRGWGKIDRTGTLEVNGKVVADGQGIDRTLNLTSFSAVQTLSATDGNPAASSEPTDPATCKTTDATTKTASIVATSTSPVQPEGNGWFAVNHGRLELPLKSSVTNSSLLTWGDSPAAQHLSLVNSVRLNLEPGNTTPASTDPTPAILSLLSPDRSDAPNLSEISGVAIGLWAVDPSVGDIPSAELTICYDGTLANDLGASISSLQLWTLGGASDSWTPVNLNSLVVDATDNMVSGYATNFDYFAVSVTPAPGQNAAHLVANHLAQIGDGIAGSSSQQSSVPEPIALPILVLGGAALLGRRQRRTI